MSAGFANEAVLLLSVLVTWCQSCCGVYAPLSVITKKLGLHLAGSGGVRCTLIYVCENDLNERLDCVSYVYCGI